MITSDLFIHNMQTGARKVAPRDDGVPHAREVKRALSEVFRARQTKTDARETAKREDALRQAKQLKDQLTLTLAGLGEDWIHEKRVRLGEGDNGLMFEVKLRVGETAMTVEAVMGTMFNGRIEPGGLFWSEIQTWPPGFDEFRDLGWRVDGRVRSRQLRLSASREDVVEATNTWERTKMPSPGQLWAAHDAAMATLRQREQERHVEMVRLLEVAVPDACARLSRGETPPFAIDVPSPMHNKDAHFLVSECNSSAPTLELLIRVQEEFVVPRLLEAEEPDETLAQWIERLGSKGWRVIITRTVMEGWAGWYLSPIEEEVDGSQ